MMSNFPVKKALKQHSSSFDGYGSDCVSLHRLFIDASISPYSDLEVGSIVE